MSFKAQILSQNFIKKDKLVNKIVRLAQFGPDDLVIDIGAGLGAITKELAKICGKVIAVEVDDALVTHLSKTFAGSQKVTVQQEDIRSFKFPESSYCVFSNIPFHITADVVYKLLHYSRPPERAYLIMQREAAEKFSGLKGSTQFSVIAGPWFEFRILYRFMRSDFYPPPGVDVVLLEIVRRKEVLIEEKDEIIYKNFVQHIFNKWKRNLKLGTKDVFTYTQWKRLAHTYKFHVKVTPSQLSLEQWIGIFKFFRKKEESL